MYSYYIINETTMNVCKRPALSAFHDCVPYRFAVSTPVGRHIYSPHNASSIERQIASPNEKRHLIFESSGDGMGYTRKAM